MPQLIDHIDKIARDKKRDVLFVIFHKDSEEPWNFEYHDCAAREVVMSWLTANNIPFYPCGHFARENMWMRHLGQLYIDVPFDEIDPSYQKLKNFLENPDGTMKISGVEFCYLPLDHAMKNAHHDAPGFWERWAENF